MMNLTRLFNRLTLGAVLASVPLLGGCGDSTITWQEEVKLLDGRVITVTQKRRIDGDRMPREAWLTFKLPEFGNQEIVWHENLETQVLNVYQGKLYVVGSPHGLRELRQYGTEYVPYRYEAGQWIRISLNEIPVAIYDVNMYPENMALERLERVSLKDKIEIFKDNRWMPSQRRIDPNYKSNFSQDTGR
ncbi:MAG: hypothetical protein ACOY3V_01925 [Pseudomonadota bacterium]